MSTVVNVYEAKAQLSRLLSAVEAGEDVIIARQGRPIVRLVRFSGSTADRVPGKFVGQIVIRDDFDDFGPDEEADWYGPIEP